MGHADGRSRVAPARSEHGGNEVGGAVHRLGQPLDAAFAVEEASQPYHLGDAIEVADSRQRLGDQVDRAKTRSLARRLGRGMGPQLADMRLGELAVRAERQLSRNEQQCAGAREGDVIGDRRGGLRQGQGEVLEALGDEANRRSLVSLWATPPGGVARD